MTSDKIIIGVSGGSGSGKTSFVNSVRSLFTKDELCILSMDEYYHPRETQREDQQGVKNFDLPSSIDYQLFKTDLEKLIKGETVVKKEYTFNNAEKEPRMLSFKSAPIILVEGLFVFYYNEISDLLDYKVFISASDDLKVIRRIKRDRIERNYPLDDVLYRYAHHVKPSYEEFIAPYKEEVDIIINNNNNYDKGLSILKGFMNDFLK